MKRQIRRNVFETNSSSMHSLTIDNKALTNSILHVNEDNKIPVELGEFGWGIENHYDQATKLSYLVVMALEKELRDVKAEDDLYQTEGFKAINDAIAEYCKCDGIVVENFGFELHSYESEGATKYYSQHNGYIDHQSCGDYASLQDYLDDQGLSILEFVFGEDITLHISNDNQ